jgi:tetratricopeptide (TPR) repeat protein
VSPTSFDTLNARPSQATPRTAGVKGRRRPLWILVAATSIALVLAAAVGWAFWPASPRTEVIWQRAQENLRSGRYDEVKTDLARLARLRAPTPLDWYLRAQLAKAQNQPDVALECLGRVPDDHPIAAEMRLLAGAIERQCDRVRRAEEAFRAAEHLDPSLVQAHRELINIYGLHVRRPEINAEFAALQKLTALSFDDVYHWTSLRNNLWEPGDVVGDLVRFVAADPLDRWSRLALADILRRMGLHQQAESTVASLPEDDPRANIIRIRIALDRQEYGRAYKLLSRGRDDDPEIAQLRGSKALAEGDARSAAKQFRIAYAAEPVDHETLFGLWTALEELGDETEARPIREAARNLDRLNTLLQRGRVPDAKQNADLMRQFGIVCAALHRNGEARAWLELAIARNPLDTEAQQVLFRLNAARRNDPKPATR